jgi:hypothetical protein
MARLHANRPYRNLTVSVMITGTASVGRDEDLMVPSSSRFPERAHGAANQLAVNRDERPHHNIPWRQLVDGEPGVGDARVFGCPRRKWYLFADEGFTIGALRDFLDDLHGGPLRDGVDFQVPEGTGIAGKLEARGKAPAGVGDAEQHSTELHR